MPKIIRDVLLLPNLTALVSKATTYAKRTPSTHGSLLVPALLATLATINTGLSSEPLPETLSSSPKRLTVSRNAHYLEYDGKPVALFGSGLWTILPDTSVNIAEHNYLPAEGGDVSINLTDLPKEGSLSAVRYNP